LEDGGWDFFSFYVTLCVWEVRETVLLEEPTRAALASFVPFGSHIVTLACEVSGPSFVHEHEYFAVRELILHHCMFLILSPSFLPVASFVSAEISAFVSASGPVLKFDACKNDCGFLRLSTEAKNDWERIFHIVPCSWRMIIIY
jgi:hypothetical protein